MAKVYESWRYSDPAKIVEASIRLSERDQRPQLVAVKPIPHGFRDRYYRSAARLHVKQLMRGKR